jgi:hypothetical protein
MPQLFPVPEMEPDKKLLFFNKPHFMNAGWKTDREFSI